MYGYVGKILRVNLSEESATEEPLKEDEATKFLGGRGLAICLLFREISPGIDPLGPENKLILATGPLTGTIFPRSSRYVVAAEGQRISQADLDSMLDEYYELRGWEIETGIPKKETLRRLGLSQAYKAWTCKRSLSQNLARSNPTSFTL